jgi:hypothetical protein
MFVEKKDMRNFGSFLNQKLRAYKLIFSFFLVTSSIYAQQINVDGIFDESKWQDAIEFSDFKTYEPDIGFKASERTRVLVTNDSLKLYFAIICEDSEPDKIMANLTNRDNLKNDDSFTIEIDIEGSANSNIFFRVNPLGIQEDGVISQNEEEDLNPDKIWYSKGIITDNGYQIEIAIPFQTLRFKWKPIVDIKMGFKRKIFRKSEIVVYPEYKPEISNRLMQRETLSFINIKKQKVLEIIPSVTYTYDQKLDNGKWNTKQNKIEAGITGKIGLTSDLVLDITYNPDFSQVESDAGQIDINLRNPLYFPEKRLFFQEGVELFNFGAQDMYNIPLEYIVHTRNIVDPIYGIKLTGNLGEKYSIASIISSDESSNINDHYQILRLRRKFKDDNYFGITYTGKENANGYNRLGGFDGVIRINGKSKIEYHFFRSYTEDTLDFKSGNSFGAYYNFKNRNNNIKIGYYQIDKEFDTQIGYLNRRGLQIIPILYYREFPLNLEKLKKISFIINSRQRRDMFSKKYEHWTYTGLEFYFNNDSWIWFGKAFATEVFQNKRFETGDFAGGYFVQFNKYIYAQGYIGWGNRIYYDEVNPYQGFGWVTNHTLLFTPTNQLKIKLSGNYANFHRTSDKKFIYDYKIARLHTTYQLNNYLFIRAVGEYNFYREQFNSEFLISFTYIPGTVIQLGYNLRAEKKLPGEYFRTNENLQINQKLLFFKASYLFNR